jgi:hypothetical protein
MRSRLTCSWLILGFAGCLVALAQLTSPPPSLPPKPPSPVAFFRELLDLDKADRARTLASRSESQRRAIEAKLLEYEALPFAERELRLQATELRWYLRPLLEADPGARTAQVAMVPVSLRALVERRLAAWDQLGSQAQREFLDRDWALQYFLRLETATPAEQASLIQQLEPARRQELEREFARWQALPPQQRLRTTERFQQFFELPPAEQQKTLQTLPETERKQIEATLQAFAQLPPPQRQIMLNAFQRFAGLTAAERSEFLRNADRWKEMSPADRATWRRLLSQLPPTPPGFFDPPAPPGLRLPPSPASE